MKVDDKTKELEGKENIVWEGGGENRKKGRSGKRKEEFAFLFNLLNLQRGL